ncbi:hypothetical protein Agabi119p4_1552 [Agaricus bisporus var. burnettii]|uniref:Uncharacterized protein n=1 Tax=Agaricus bisporus var. burnettii TaxID=192524 RepID=A0A8H7KJ82_AGABI|nr:hypothetical protein Agabi119p4_1552 [Agaricus bisporus var. burnettii]
MESSKNDEKQSEDQLSPPTLSFSFAAIAYQPDVERRTNYLSELWVNLLYTWALFIRDGLGLTSACMKQLKKINYMTKHGALELLQRANMIDLFL